MTVFCRYETHTAQESGSQLWCHAVLGLQFTHVTYFACRGGLRKSREDCSAVSLYCVTMPRQQTCKGSLYIMVAGVLLYETVERTHLGMQVMQRGSDMLIAVSHVHLYFMKRSTSESVAMLPQD